MSLNQYAVYQLKADTSVRHLRYRSYAYLMENHLKVDADNYHQVYLSTMLKDTRVEEIRGQLEKKLPPQFMGAALNVSDVIAITKEGISTAYYVDKSSLVVISGFFRTNTSATLITMETTGFIFDDRKGSWMATDETVIDGKLFFLMASETYGRNAAYAVVDSQGIKAAEDTVNGFDEKTIQQIREYLKPEEKRKADPSRTPDGKVRLEIWQKYQENGEYLRSVESGTEDNYNMIDGNHNNKTVHHAKERVSVLKRLREKQAEVAARYGRKAEEQEKDDMERNRK